MFSFKAKYANTWPAILSISITGVFSMVCLIALMIHQLDVLLKKERYSHVKSQVLTAKQMVELSAKYYEDKSEAQVKQIVLGMLSELRYPEGGYFWVLDNQGVMLTHPFSKGVVGNSTLDLLDVNGKLFVNEMLMTAKSGGGFVTYSWIKPGGEDHFPKVAYVTQIKGWDWIIGSGSYFDDLEAATRHEVYRNALICLLLILMNGLVLLIVSRQFINRFHNNAVRDELTGLMNRRYLEEVSPTFSDKAQMIHRPVSMLFFDIDHFKAINDKYGHRAGDLVLRQLGQILKEFTKMNDLSFRYGGEEFVLLLDSNVDDAVKVAEDLRQYIENKSFDIGKTHIHITVSIGVSSNVSHDISSIKDLVLRADTAMYQAKSAGRNCIRVYG